MSRVVIRHVEAAMMKAGEAHVRKMVKPIWVDLDALEADIDDILAHPAMQAIEGVVKAAVALADRDTSAPGWQEREAAAVASVEHAVDHLHETEWAE